MNILRGIVDALGAAAAPPDAALPEGRGNMKTLQKIMELRPYVAGKSNCITFDLEEQLQGSLNRMKVADLVAFAERAEAYILKRYGDSGRQYIASRAHWIGPDEYKRNLAACWEALDDSTRTRLRADPVCKVVDDMCNEMLPRAAAAEAEEGGPATFVFRDG